MCFGKFSQYNIFYCPQNYPITQSNCLEINSNSCWQESFCYNSHEREKEAIISFLYNHFKLKSLFKKKYGAMLGHAWGSYEMSGIKPKSALHREVPSQLYYLALVPKATFFFKADYETMDVCWSNPESLHSPLNSLKSCHFSKGLFYTQVH